MSDMALCRHFERQRDIIALAINWIAATPIRSNPSVRKPGHIRENRILRKLVLASLPFDGSYSVVSSGQKLRAVLPPKAHVRRLSFKMLQRAISDISIIPGNVGLPRKR